MSSPFLIAYNAFIILFIPSSIVALSLASRDTTTFTTPTENQLPKLKEPNFHQVLEKLGKTTLRPGGIAATKALCAWSQLSPFQHLLELSGGFGKTGILFATEKGCQVTITDLDDNRITATATRIKEEDDALKDLLHFQVMDMFQLDESFPNTKFDCIITEASLTHFPFHIKQELLQKISAHTDQYLLHEVCFKTNESTLQNQIHTDMQKVLKIGFYPETVDTWKELLQDAGFTSMEQDQIEVGNIGIINPVKIIEEEGLCGAANIAMNVLTQPYMRSRVFDTKRMLSKHEDSLGYVILRATKSKIDVLK